MINLQFNSNNFVKFLTFFILNFVVLRYLPKYKLPDIELGMVAAANTIIFALINMNQSCIIIEAKKKAD